LFGISCVVFRGCSRLQSQLHELPHPPPLCSRLQLQLQASSAKIDNLTAKNKDIALQLEVSERRCKELLLEGRAMQEHIDDQAARIDKFNESMRRLSVSAAAAAAKDDTIQQLQRDAADKDSYIQKLLDKFHSSVGSLAAGGGGGGGGGGGPGIRTMPHTPRVSGALRAVKDIMTAPPHDSLAESSSLGRGKAALEQLDFLAKVFEQELGIVQTSLSHESNIWAAAHGKKETPRPRPSPVIAPEKLQAMLAADNQAPPPSTASNLDAAPSSRPLFLARRLRPATPPPPPPPPPAPDTQSLDAVRTLVSACADFCPVSLQLMPPLSQQPVLTSKAIAPLVRPAALHSIACRPPPPPPPPPPTRSPPCTFSRLSAARCFRHVAALSSSQLQPQYHFDYPPRSSPSFRPSRAEFLTLCAQAPLSARGRIETRLQMPMGFGANAGSLVGAAGAQSFRIDAPGFAQLEPSVPHDELLVLMMITADVCAV
jgi:hypothetical protein